MRAPLFLPVVACLALLVSGCGDEEAPAEAAPAFAANRTTVPAPTGSRTPRLATGSGGRLYLSWQEPAAGDSTALRFAARQEGGRWTAPRTVATGADWIVNWADFPAFLVREDGRLVTHALARNEPESFSYDVHLFQSDDGGASWRSAGRPHDDGTATEHGFVSLVAGPEGTADVVWLDGRKYAGGTKEMTLRYASLTPEGTLRDEAVLDERTCDCCQTAAVRTPNALVVAYRDRTADEVRDVSVVRRVDGRWAAPEPLHRDGWVINGCPVNGPAMDARGAQVAVAWFTMQDGAPHVRAAFSDDEGATFTDPVAVHDAPPVGRVGLALLDDGRALVSWIGRTEGGYALQVRTVAADGTRGPVRTVAPISGERASGFPQMAVGADSVHFAWTASQTADRDSAAVHVEMAAAALASF